MRWARPLGGRFLASPEGLLCGEVFSGPSHACRLQQLASQIGTAIAVRHYDVSGLDLFNLTNYTPILWRFEEDFFID